MIDIVIELEHPQIEPVATASKQLGCEMFRCASANWSAAIAAGQADWIALVDRRAELSSADLRRLETGLAQSTTPICLQPWSDSNPAEWFAWQACPSNVAVCWNNPVRYAAICVRRSRISTLPELQETHLDVLWDWLSRSAMTPGSVSFAATDTLSAPWKWPADSFVLLPALVPSAMVSRDAWLIEQITGLKPSQLVPEKTSEADSVALKAGLLQWHDALDASHQLAQSVEGLGKHQAGDYWHAIMHRREPDYGNAKYWFRQFGSHAVFSDLPADAAGVLDGIPEGEMWKSRLTGRGTWDPFAFVDLCEACAGREDLPLGWAARQIQAAEMQLLLAATYRDASGRS